MGKWNGVGGKVEKGESNESAAIRELKEEIGVKTDIKNLEKTGHIKFYFKDRPEWDQHMHIFLVKKWTGNPKESDEMKPMWFSRDKIPFNSMWPDDKHWMSIALAGKKFEGEFYFINEGSAIDDFKLKEI